MLKLLGFFCLAVVCSVPCERLFGQKRPNVLLVSVDDMNFDSLGCHGCSIPGITPHIDRLASQGILFSHAHVTIAVCQPTRSVWLTGRYPFNNGALGFQPIRRNVPTLTEQLRKAGYLNGILGKVKHLAPRDKFAWDYMKVQNELGFGRDSQLYYRFAKQFLARTKVSKKPFFLMVNSHDPHRPFANSKQEKNRKKRKKLKIPAASKIYKPAEVTVPGFLPDIPPVRREIAQYFSSVHRADETVGAVLKALKESGMEQNTLVMFLSDHGMALPFAKTNCYMNSTRTPWIIRWPGKVKPNRIDKINLISGIDLTPTMLDALGLAPLEGVDGKSFLPLMFEKKQSDREEIMTVFHRTAGRRDYPMRSLVTKQYGYIYNGWSDGKTVFRNESQAGLTFRAMQKAGKTNPEIAQRVKLFQYRVREEFFDYSKDPDARKNLINDPTKQKTIQEFRQRLLKRMKRYHDPLAEKFAEEMKLSVR